MTLGTKISAEGRGRFVLFSFLKSLINFIFFYHHLPPYTLFHLHPHPQTPQGRFVFHTDSQIAALRPAIHLNSKML